MLECCRKHAIRRFVHVSTDEVYGETTSNENSLENTILAPTNPYAASKAAAEHLVESYFKCFNLPFVITRSNNIFGPHQFPEKMIPKFICRLERKLPCCIHGTGKALRSFMYISDAVRAFDLILHQGIEGQIYNIEAGEEFQILQVAHLLLAYYGLEKEAYKHIVHVADRLFNDQRYHINGNKLRNLGFQPVVTFQEGLKRTIEWYRTTKIEKIWPNFLHVLSSHPLPIDNDTPCLDPNILEQNMVESLG